MTLIEPLSVAAGGAMGCLCRYALEFIPAISTKPLPVIAANLAGCILIGIVSALLAHFNASAVLNRLLVTGLLGGFTTFSAFALHPVMLIRQGLWAEAIGYVTLSVIGGLLLCAVAMTGTEYFLKTTSAL
ncbi:MAG: CrcB family protein [Paramuribaculum sp.]|nr:CrcB family protein [Paramuribaculum sp.]